ncbi:COR domain-containing protein [Nocardioides sp. T5]|uniref:COR domain-containing protein n=1 Tax=Nocardioides sp. T5 TaxID=3400182 RepID=UPI003A85F125
MDYNSVLADALSRVRANQSPALIVPEIPFRSKPTSDVQIRRFPVEICEFTWLKELSLPGQAIDELPPEIGQLKNLDALYLQGNRIERLPDSFSDLTGLRFANLTSNQLRSLPDGLGALSNLNTLAVAGNRITSLPPDIDERVFRCLSGLDKNPLEDSLRPILESGSGAVVAYLRSLSAGTAQYEAKLVIVGEGDVGKSSLLGALQGVPFVENRPTTHGIEIQALRLQHPAVEDRVITLNCWDFGGQEVYRISHQFFFSKRSLYVVVWNTRQGHEANGVEGWLTRLRLRIGDDARILVVATHADLRRAEIDFPSLQRSFGDVLVGHMEVDSRSGRGLAELKVCLAEEAAQLPQMGSLLSTHWINVREHLSRLEESFISYERYEEICADNDLDGAEASALSALLHDLGAIIHYAEDDGLRDFVVLQPEWLTKAIGFVLEDEQTRENGGVLEHRWLAEIWGSRNDLNYPKVLYPYFLRLMEKFDVSYRLIDEESSLVAQLVPHERPALSAVTGSTTSATGAPLRQLALQCKMDEEAPGLVSWLTVRNHRFSIGRHWRRGVELEYRQYESRAILELSDSRTLKLTVTAPSPDFFFAILRDGIEDLLRRRWPGLEFDFFIPCSSTKDCAGFFALQLVQRYREKGRTSIDCPECLESQDVGQLLTAFSPAREDELVLLQAIRAGQENMRDQLSQIESYAARAANQTRALLRAASVEVTDCPRLFTVEYADGRLGWAKKSIALHLWCEATGEEHSLATGPYRIDDWQEWVRKAARYTVLVGRVLSLFVPVATTGIADLVSSEDAELINRHLDLAKDIGGGTSELAKLVAGDDPRVDQGLQLADAVALRGFRELLFSVDPQRQFGGLRRVTTPDGHLLWLCSEHAWTYDPGLPSV